MSKSNHELTFGDRIQIGDNITLYVVEIGTDPVTGVWRVVLGVDAPRGVPIDRAEVHAAKKANA